MRRKAGRRQKAASWSTKRGANFFVAAQEGRGGGVTSQWQQIRGATVREEDRKGRRGKGRSGKREAKRRKRRERETERLREEREKVEGGQGGEEWREEEGVRVTRRQLRSNNFKCKVNIINARHWRLKIHGREIFRYWL